MSEGHIVLIHDVEIIVIGKTDLSDSTKREKVWRTKLRTFPTEVLNVRG